MGLSRTTIHKVEFFGGEFGHHKEIAEYLTGIHTSGDRRDSDPHSIKWQDKELPEDKESYPDVIKALINVACESLLETVGGIEVQHSRPWTIINGPLEQTYPHLHDDLEDYYAFVYWAKAPKNSGNLCLYPTNDIRNEYAIIPKEGKFCIFNGNILHGVRHNATQENRISMSMNLRVTR